MKDLGTLGGRFSSAHGLNDLGQVVGQSDLLSTAHAFVWTASEGMRDLGTLNGGGVSFADAIDDLGQIVGASSTSSMRSPAVLWTPIRIDTTPPTVTIVSVTPDTLWPPNGQMVTVTISGSITDAGSGVDASTTAYAVTDEYGLIQPSGYITNLNATTGNYTFTIQLQASRRGNDRDGRQYTIIVSAQDEEGNMGSASARVIVPQNQGG
jgi:probable HAF family extracellular repeat protein